MTVGDATADWLDGRSRKMICRMICPGVRRVFRHTAHLARDAKSTKSHRHPRRTAILGRLKACSQQTKTELNWTTVREMECSRTPVTVGLEYVCSELTEHQPS